MKHRNFVLFIIIILIAGCSKDKVSGSGAVVTEDRPEANFTGVSMGGSNNVHITKGAGFRVQVKGYGNLLPYYETRVANGVLKLGYKDVNIRNDNIEVFVTMPGLNFLSISGSGDMDVHGNFDGNSTFQTIISGSGNIGLEQGTARDFSSTISGSGNVAAFGIAAENAIINVSGSGNTEITATAILDVTISGSGNVYYKGKPVVTSHVSGSGAIIPK